MNQTTIFHHSLPSGFSDFATSLNANQFRKNARRKTARAHFLAQAKSDKLKVRAIGLPLRDLPAEVMPVLYFTRKGGHPLTILSRSGREFEVRMWDGREMVCDLRRLERSVLPEGYFMGANNAWQWFCNKATNRELLSELLQEKSHLGLGLASGVVSSSILLGFCLSLFRFLESGFLLTIQKSPLLAIFALVATAFLVMGFLQVRGWVHRLVQGLSADLRLHEHHMPQPRPIRSLASIDSARGLVDLALAPWFVAAGLFAVMSATSSVASWALMIACLTPLITACSVIFEIRDSWEQSLWLIKGRRESSLVDDIIAIRHKATPPAIEVQDLQLAHPDGQSQPLINGISLRLLPGEKLGIIGERVTDISILLRVLSGGITPDEGNIWINGHPVDRQTAGQKVAGISWFSERRSLEAGTVRDHLLSDLSSKNITEVDIELALELVEYELCTQYGIDEWIGKSGQGFSGKKKVQLQLARALINRPSILVIDSPNDAQNEQTVKSTVSRYLEANPSCSLILGGSGSIDEQLVDRVLTISNGRFGEPSKPPTKPANTTETDLK